MGNKKRGASFKASISITLTALISGFALSFLNSALADDIATNQLKATLEAVSLVIPNAKEVGEPIEDGEVSYYIGRNDSGEVVGYAFRISEVGYAGDVPVMIGYNSSLSKITTIAPLDNSETPNIGSKIADEPFRSSFDGGASSINYTIVKAATTDVESGVINAITGATVSSGAVVSAINKANAYIAENESSIEK